MRGRKVEGDARIKSSSHRGFDFALYRYLPLGKLPAILVAGDHVSLGFVPSKKLSFPTTSNLGTHS